MSAARVPVAFLFDVDNTLLDNDRVKLHLAAAIEALVGAVRASRFWELYEEVRVERDFVDYPHTLERFAREVIAESGFPAMADLVLSYPYRRATFPGALDALRHARRSGPVAILSDGDPVYQPAKIARSGISEVIDGPVLVFPHKEEHLDEVERLVPADRYVMVDDKPRILALMRERLGARVTTWHVCQGSYAHADEHDDHPPADATVDMLAQLPTLPIPD